MLQGDLASARPLCRILTKPELFRAHYAPGVGHRRVSQDPCTNPSKKPSPLPTRAGGFRTYPLRPRGSRYSPRTPRHAIV